MKSTVKCYQCKEDVQKVDAIVERYKTLKNEYNRYFHSDNCHRLYIQMMEEEKKWKSLYQYIKVEIFRYDTMQSLSKHCVSRLKGLRSGNYGVRKNTKVSLSEHGYPYEIIHMTFKVKKVDILNSFADKSKFSSEEHQVDYMMAIIQNHINDVYQRVREREENDKKLKKFIMPQFDTEISAEFVNKTKIDKNKVANKLKHLF
ncbi:hypothetical protein [Brevibacillus laterosporus]|uniref:hypothetical protein n=1 Tax=Brevibacillus laterosporus TaxID=1465 RepID=UPI000CE36744|nr:hypothetical protein [Brevibacillus laterosporus]MED1665675.1 hypothetical protein [Brevibacillus laterosporus]MED1667236.1 hypothetical protein [Brevibacillus laterosporus]MED1719696.1 hypothetical protein [Brevibacillus laterosporus]PPA84972.1 hypothetical protein C4A75_09345 [Brevibacillus laterosporus]